MAGHRGGQGLQPSLSSTCEDRGPHRGAVHTYEKGRLLLTHGKSGRGSDGTADLSLWREEWGPGWGHSDTFHMKFGHILCKSWEYRPNQRESWWGLPGDQGPEARPQVIQVKPARLPTWCLSESFTPPLPVGALSHGLKTWFWPQRLTMYEFFSIFNWVTGAKNLEKALPPDLGVGPGMQPYHRRCTGLAWTSGGRGGPEKLPLVLPVDFIPLASASCSFNLTSYIVFTGLLYTPYHRENKCHQKWASWNFLPSIAVILWYNKKCVFWSLPLAPGQSS